MEMTLDTLIALLGLFVGGGGGAFFTWRWQRKKAKAEAQQAESCAAKEWQDFYQQAAEDANRRAKDDREYINELKEDRHHLREERDELRNRLDRLDETVRGLQRDVARNGRMVECMRPLLCGRRNCPDRVAVTVSADAGIEEKDIEPLAMKDL